MGRSTNKDNVKKSTHLVQWAGNEDLPEAENIVLSLKNRYELNIGATNSS
jgi:hypothetical protein